MDGKTEDKMDDKFILMGLDDEKAGDIAEVLKNKTCKKILDFLAEIKEASEKDISDSLKMPINTIEYNLQKLVKSGLVEKAKNFFWSVKGKKIDMYKLARKHIIISPSKKPNINYLKSILPVIIAAIAIIAIIMLIYPGLEKFQTGSRDSPIQGVVEESKLKQFGSYDDLKDFLEENKAYESYGYYGAEEMGMGGTVTAASGAASKAADAGATSYSETNIQVEGVDEPDIVKNDGKYIYVVSGNKVVIVDAYPAEDMEILSEIELNESNNVGNIFINEDKLVVFSSGYEYVPYREKCMIENEEVIGCRGYSRYKNIVYIYDISDRENPELENELEIEGSYKDSRMIGDYVYVISNKYINSDRPELPVYIMDGVEKAIAPSDIYYFPYPDTSYVFTSITAIDISDGDYDAEVYLTGSTSTVYVSQDNIYLTHQKRISYDYKLERMVEEVYLPLLTDEYDEKITEIVDSDDYAYLKMSKINELIEDYTDTLTGDDFSDFSENLMDELEEFEAMIEKESEKTIIHKINVNKLKIKYKEAGEVLGRVLNQFSMDEYDGYFRIATTTGTFGETSLNHVYVLNTDLQVVGSVEDLAEGERIFSARFLGERVYLVTFEAIDPLFVISLEDPENPEVLGYLKIPGYSDYLHPYDENHVIGIGKDVNASIDADKVHSSHAVYYTAVLGVKVSLFDVSDVENPIEEDKFVIGDRGTSSPILNDHKAFLFDKEKNLLVVPVEVSELVKEPKDWDPDYGYSKRVWQGAYVFNIDDNGLDLRGTITHDKDIGKENYYPNYEYSIKRSLYMDDVLYTISKKRIKANSLDDLDEIESISLSYEEDYGYLVVAEAQQG